MSLGSRLESIMPKYCITILFRNSLVLLPIKVLPLSSNYAHFIIEKTPQTQRGTNIPPAGIHLPPLFILAAPMVRRSLSWHWSLLDLLL